MYNNYEILEGVCTVSPSDPAIKYPFECDDFQKHSFNAIEKGNNVLVTAKTGCGKTAVGEYAVAYHIKKGGRVIYTTPVKSLSNEKYRELKDRFPDFSVGLLTGDNKINVDSQCLIATAEILRNSLYKLKDSLPNETHEIKTDFVDSITCVVMDEVHFINDPDRGKVWEETLVLLDQSVQLIMLSATIDNAERFASWLGFVRTKCVSLIPAIKRVIPLKHYIYLNDALYLIQDDNDFYHSEPYNDAKKVYNKMIKEREAKHKSFINFNMIEHLIKFMKTRDMLQAIFFSFSRANCEKYAEAVTTTLIDHEDSAKIKGLFDKYMSKYKKDYELLPQYNKVRSLLEKGIAYHHSGLLPIIKEIIEIIFKTGLIKVLFATETFAVGVNMPTRTVVFTEVTKFTRGVKRFLNTAEYKQMSGRAGRRGLDVTGNVIILPLHEYPDENDLKSVILNSMPSVTSKFKIDYSFVIKTRRSTITDSEHFFSKSLLNSEQKSMLSGVLKDYSELQKTKCIIETELQDVDTKSFLEYYNKMNEPQTFGGLKVVMSKQQQKRLQILKKDIDKIDPDKKLYKLFCDLMDINKKITNIDRFRDETDAFLNHIVINISNVLFETNFIDSSGNLTIKGIIASQINECNCLLLTEIITSNILDDLSAPEIVAVLSIFSSYNKKTDVEYKPRIISTQIQEIKNIVNRFTTLESENGVVIDDPDMWTITTDYVDISYLWATGSSVTDIIAELITIDDYEGNFVKNILKIYNIIHDVKCMATILKKIDLVRTLECIDALILRDIVNVNSLYLA
jgi:superfamily II RNA helicase